IADVADLLAARAGRATGDHGRAGKGVGGGFGLDMRGAGAAGDAVHDGAVCGDGGADGAGGGGGGAGPQVGEAVAGGAGFADGRGAGGDGGGVAVFVEEGDGDVAVGQGFGQDVQAAGGGDHGALFAEAVLVDGDDVLVGQDRQGGAGGVGDVGAGDQGCGHLRPQRELGLLFGGAHAVADFQHVRVVPVPGTGIGGQAHVAVEDGEHAAEAGVDVTGGAPGVPDARAPGPRALEAPVAQAEQDRPAGGGQCVAHRGVAALGAGTAVTGLIDAVGVAVVVLEVVHAPGGEGVRVGGFVAEVAGVAGAGHGAGVLVDAEFEAEGVHVACGAGDS